MDLSGTKQPHPDMEDKSTPEAHGVMDTLRENSLKAAGVGQLIADTSLLTYSLLTGNMKIGSVGLLGYTVGTIGTRYGNPKAEKKLEQIERHLGEYLRKEGVEIPKDPTTESLMKKAGVIDHVESFLYQYPSQMMNVCFSLMGVQFARAGLQSKSKSLVTSGALLIAGALAGLLIQEQKPDPEHPPEGFLQNAWSKIQEKPLRLSGTLFNLNQVGLAMDALGERNKNPGNNSYMFKLLAVAAFTFGNTMFALSSKGGHGASNGMDDETLNTLSETSAKIILAQPPEVQNALLEHIAGYLSTQPSLGMKAADISAMLHQKLVEVATNHETKDHWQGRAGDTGPELPYL